MQIIAIDGPASSGKGTVAKKLSRQLNYHYLDSGAIYRIIALACIKKNIAIEKNGALSQLIQKLNVCFDGDSSFLENENVTEQIRDERVGKVASYIAQNINLRNSILDYQRSFAKKPGLVAEGRDMATVVFPQANLKIYLDASVNERAERRYKQLILKGIDVNILDLASEIIARDKQDMERQHSPLVKDKDSIVINTDCLDINQTVKKILSFIKN
ncbi:MAG: (d)CMP kinase [Methylophilaceae bacterium]|nr:(d)CMP kinase [Methylophilaceae bacterium]MBL6729083.1 (d)CMP kinase [Methylophilaceae bacterium]